MNYLDSKLEKGWQEYENALVSIYCSCTYISKCGNTAFYGKGQENCHCIGGFRNTSFYSRLPVAKIGIMGKYEIAVHLNNIGQKIYSSKRRRLVNRVPSFWMSKTLYEIKMSPTAKRAVGEKRVLICFRRDNCLNCLKCYRILFLIVWL